MERTDINAGSIAGPLRTIMVVDDDQDMRDLLALWLGAESFAVVTARDGEEALRLLGQGCRPDVIVLDLMMPVVDGWMFLRAKNLHAQIAGIPVVVVSAVAPAAEPWPSGITAMIQKPCDFDLLVKSVDLASAGLPQAL